MASMEDEVFELADAMQRLCVGKSKTVVTRAVATMVALAAGQCERPVETINAIALAAAHAALENAEPAL